jgi:hypothetical protein
MLVGSRARPVTKQAALLQFVRQLSKCGVLSISQTYGPPRPITGIAFLYSNSIYWNLTYSA